MTPEELAALAYVSCARRRHKRNRAAGGYRSSPLLGTWCAWEDARDRLAVAVAEDLANDWTGSLDDDLAAYRVAAERERRACARYIAAENAKAIAAVAS